MSPRRRLFNFAIDDHLAAGLKAIKARTGVSESEQVRRAIQMWLESQGEMKEGGAQAGGHPQTLLTTQQAETCRRG